MEEEEEELRKKNKDLQADLNPGLDPDNEDSNSLLRLEVIAAMPAAQRAQIAQSEKEKGNEAFYAQDLGEADMHYSRAILYAVEGDQAAVYTNRALVRLRLGNNQGAKADCTKALAAKPNYMKALHRRGRSRETELHEGAAPAG